MAAHKRLIVCCDGTWNDTDSGDSFTNVARLGWAIAAKDTRGPEEIPQIVYYHSGVGTGDAFDRALGGGAGVGLSRNVRDAYAFLANNYCDGDEVFLFGFSRGAYTARSIGGVIGYAGLLHKKDMDRFAVLWEGYRLRGKQGQVDPRPQFPDRHSPVRIKCIGVWDTVGSLGIPGNVDQAFTSFYEFHDTGLGAHVDNAFHALGLDEARKDFQPTLWQQDPAAKANGQVLQQVWFAGAHSNVGGGYDEHGLSDITLAWMAGQVADLLAIDVDYLKAKRDLRNGWGLGKLYNSAEGPIWQLRGTQPRTPTPGNAATCESIHPSVAERGKQGADSVPKPYASAALRNINVSRSLSQLSAIETGLQWSAQDVRAAPPAAKLQTSLFNLVLRSVGGG